MCSRCKNIHWQYGLTNPPIPFPSYCDTVLCKYNLTLNKSQSIIAMYVFPLSTCTGSPIFHRIIWEYYIVILRWPFYLLTLFGTLFFWDIFCVNSNSPMALLPSDTGREKEDKWCCHRCACKVSTKKSHQWGKNRGTDLTKLQLGNLTIHLEEKVKLVFQLFGQLDLSQCMNI